MASGQRSQRAVLPSMSVNRKVTVPVGSAALTFARSPHVLSLRDGIAKISACQRISDEPIDQCFEGDADARTSVREKARGREARQGIDFENVRAQISTDD